MDDGCGATLAWWFGEDAAVKRVKKRKAEVKAGEPTLPETCAAVMARAKP